MKTQEINYGPRRPLSLDIGSFTILENICKATGRSKASILQELLANKSRELQLPEVVVIDRPAVGRPRSL